MNKYEIVEKMMKAAEQVLIDLNVAEGSTDILKTYTTAAVPRFAYVTTEAMLNSNQGDDYINSFHKDHKALLNAFYDSGAKSARKEHES